MALESLPPWLNVGPTDYLHATQTGGAAGLGIAEAQNRARAEAARIEQANRDAAQRAWEFTVQSRNSSRDAANRIALAQQETMARMHEAQRAAAQREWEFGERMRQAAEENYSGNALKQQQLDQQGKYQEGMLDYHQGQLGELSAHNQAMESISAEKAARLLDAGQAEIVEHPEAPGLKFLRNPSGAESVIERPEKEMTPAQKATFALKAFNAFKPLSSEEDVEGPMYGARTNYAGSLLRDMGALPTQGFGREAWSGMDIPAIGQQAAPVPSEGTLLNQDWMQKPETPQGVQEVIRKTRDGRRAVFDAETKEFLRYAD